MKHISKLTHLEVLNLPGSQITDRGLEYLTRLRKLSYLDLRNASLTDGCIETLAILPKNVGISVQGKHRISKENLKELRRRRPDMVIYD